MTVYVELRVTVPVATVDEGEEAVRALTRTVTAALRAAGHVPADYEVSGFGCTYKGELRDGHKGHDGFVPSCGEGPDADPALGDPGRGG
jgi:hypothetical protein